MSTSNNKLMNFTSAIENKIFSSISIPFLVFAARWITRCRLNKMKTVGN